jgi:hypothetical protein
MSMELLPLVGILQFFLAKEAKSALKSHHFYNL